MSNYSPHPYAYTSSTDEYPTPPIDEPTDDASDNDDMFYISAGIQRPTTTMDSTVKTRVEPPDELSQDVAQVTQSYWTSLQRSFRHSTRRLYRIGLRLLLNSAFLGVAQVLMAIIPLCCGIKLLLSENLTAAIDFVVGLQLVQLFGVSIGQALVAVAWRLRPPERVSDALKKLLLASIGGTLLWSLLVFPEIYSLIEAFTPAHTVYLLSVLSWAPLLAAAHVTSSGLTSLLCASGANIVAPLSTCVGAGLVLISLNTWLNHSHHHYLSVSLSTVAVLSASLPQIFLMLLILIQPHRLNIKLGLQPPTTSQGGFNQVSLSKALWTAFRLFARVVFIQGWLSVASLLNIATLFSFLGNLSEVCALAMFSLTVDMLSAPSSSIATAVADSVLYHQGLYVAHSIVAGVLLVFLYAAGTCLGFILAIHYFGWASLVLWVPFLLGGFVAVDGINEVARATTYQLSALERTVTGQEDSAAPAVSGAPRIFALLSVPLTLGLFSLLTPLPQFKAEEHLVQIVTPNDFFVKLTSPSFNLILSILCLSILEMLSVLIALGIQIHRNVFLADFQLHHRHRTLSRHSDTHPNYQQPVFHWSKADEQDPLLPNFIHQRHTENEQTPLYITPEGHPQYQSLETPFTLEQHPFMQSDPLGEDQIVEGIPVDAFELQQYSHGSKHPTKSDFPLPSVISRTRAARGTVDTASHVSVPADSTKPSLLSRLRGWFSNSTHFKTNTEAATDSKHHRTDQTRTAVTVGKNNRHFHSILADQQASKIPRESDIKFPLGMSPLVLPPINHYDTPIVQPRGLSL